MAEKLGVVVIPQENRKSSRDEKGDFFLLQYLRFCVPWFCYADPTPITTLEDSHGNDSRRERCLISLSSQMCSSQERSPVKYRKSRSKLLCLAKAEKLKWGIEK